MDRTLLKSKIHRVTITAADLHYEGSISLDEDLLREADILPYEQVTVADINNGQRFETYAISAPAGSGTIQVNGAAARLVQKGDLVIVMSYASYSEAETRRHTARIVLVDDHNRVARTIARRPGQGESVPV